MKHDVFRRLLVIAMMLGFTIVLSGCASKSGFGAYGYSGAEPLTTVRIAQDSFVAPAARPVDRDREELWIVARDKTQSERLLPPAAAVDQPFHCGMGNLLFFLPHKKTTIPAPLQHTSVNADIAAYIASVNVKQQFHNPFNEKIEATYVFPLPENAAVNGFVMTIGDRHIRGIIREREEAEQIYRDARAQGKVASLLTQERPNVFTQKVANIEPGRDIDVDITYFHTLTHDDGWMEFVFPMVVGPRFNPPGTSGGIGAAPRTQARRGNQPTAVSYLDPSERTTHDIDLTVNIDAGVDIEKVVSVNHSVDVHEPVSGNDAKRTVVLRKSDSVPNKDFVLRFKVAGDRVKSAVLAHQTGGDGYFTMVIHPPAQLDRTRHQPLEMIFVLDCSGSMSGKPIDQAKDAVGYALGQLDERDTFQLIRFSNDASQLGPQPVAASSANVRAGKKYLRGLEGSGGTMMIEGIRAALDFPHDRNRLRVVCFLTDGFIGNEADILREVDQRLGDTRIFSFGVGSSPNRFLLDQLAQQGRGTVAYLGLNDRGSDVMAHFLERAARHAVMTDIKIDFQGVQVQDVYPSRNIDLFIGRPVIVTGRYQGSLVGSTVRVTGNVNEDGWSKTLDLRPRNDSIDHHPGIASVWARAKIADLQERQIITSDPHQELADMIRRTALDYNLVSAYTSFVAVDARSNTAGDHGVTIEQPVQVPEGVRYDTTVER